MLGQILRLNRDDLCMMAGVPLGTFAVIHIITAIALLIFAPCDSILLAGTMSLIFSAVVTGFAAMGHIMVTFSQAVQFSQTRRRALGLSIAVIGLEVLVNLAVIGVLTALEWVFAPKFWQWLTGATGYQIMSSARPMVEVGSDGGFVLGIDTFLLEWQAFLVVPVVAAMLGIIAGAVVMRFGKKGGWAMWGLWMGCCLLLPRLPWRQYTIVDWLIPLAAVVLIISFIWSIRLLLRMAVK